MSDSTDTTRLADIRRRIEIARSDGEDKVALGEYIEFLAHAPSDLEWLLAQLDDATIRGDKLYQYGQSADAAYAELARILRETEEQAQSAQGAANAEITRLQQADDMAAQAIAALQDEFATFRINAQQQCDAYADRVWTLEAENLKLRTVEELAGA